MTHIEVNKFSHFPSPKFREHAQRSGSTTPGHARAKALAEISLPWLLPWQSKIVKIQLIINILSLPLLKRLVTCLLPAMSSGLMPPLTQRPHIFEYVWYIAYTFEFIHCLYRNLP